MIADIRKCGHTFLNSTIYLTYFDTMEVSATEIMSKFCFACQTNSAFQHKLNNYYEGTSRVMKGTAIVSQYL